MSNSANPGTEVSAFLNIAKDLSAANRRLYRAGRDYHIKKITVVSKNTPNLENRISFSTIPESWVSQMAWKRGFDTWRKMQADAIKQMSGDIKGTWDDFKVYMSPDHVGGTVLTPLDNGGNAYPAGEWVYTKLVSPDGTTGADEFHLTMLGDHSGSAGAWTRVGLIKSYGESRATVQDTDPNVPGTASDDPLVNVFDYGTTIDEVIDRMEVEGDGPPYEVASYPGDNSNTPKPLVAQDTTLIDGRAVVGGFVARCGMIEVESTSSIENDVFSILVEVAPGPYRGIKADVI